MDTVFEELVKLYLTDLVGNDIPTQKYILDYDIEKKRSFLQQRISRNSISKSLLKNLPLLFNLSKLGLITFISRDFFNRLIDIGIFNTTYPSPPRGLDYSKNVFSKWSNSPNLKIGEALLLKDMTSMNGYLLRSIRKIDKNTKLGSPIFIEAENQFSRWGWYFKNSSKLHFNWNPFRKGFDTKSLQDYLSNQTVDVTLDTFKMFSELKPDFFKPSYFSFASNGITVTKKHLIWYSNNIYVFDFLDHEKNYNLYLSSTSFVNYILHFNDSEEDDKKFYIRGAPQLFCPKAYRNYYPPTQNLDDTEVFFVDLPFDFEDPFFEFISYNTVQSENKIYTTQLKRIDSYKKLVSQYIFSYYRAISHLYWINYINGNYNNIRIDTTINLRSMLRYGRMKRLQSKSFISATRYFYEQQKKQNTTFITITLAIHDFRDYNNFFWGMKRGVKKGGLEKLPIDTYYVRDASHKDPLSLYYEHDKSVFGYFKAMLSIFSLENKIYDIHNFEVLLKKLETSGEKFSVVEGEYGPQLLNIIDLLDKAKKNKIPQDVVANRLYIKEQNTQYLKNILKVMREVSKVSEKFKDSLLETLDMYIVYDHTNKFLGNGPTVKVTSLETGSNYYGQILMHIRKEIRFDTEFELILYRNSEQFFIAEEISLGLRENDLQESYQKLDFFFLERPLKVEMDIRKLEIWGRFVTYGTLKMLKNFDKQTLEMYLGIDPNLSVEEIRDEFVVYLSLDLIPSIFKTSTQKVSKFSTVTPVIPTLKYLDELFSYSSPPRLLPLEEEKSEPLEELFGLNLDQELF